MSTFISNNSSSVTISGAVTATTSCSVPSASQTVINVSATGNGSNQNAYTVTNGKTFYLMGVWCQPGAYAAQVYRNDGATRVCFCSSAASGIMASVAGNSPIWAYTSTQNVVVNCTTGGIYGVWGIEV